MKINNNIQALNAYRNLYQNQMNTSKNLEKLSSGLRINRAADDAAGLAISEKMRSQIRGLKMAERNAMDGISLMQTSEGAMQEVHEMLQRMRELAVQGANDTNTNDDREQIQKEIEQLLTEIDSVAEKTEFNTRKLLNGESAVLTTYNDGQNAAGIQGDPTVINPNIISGNYGLSVQNSEIVKTLPQPNAGINDASMIDFTDKNESHQLGEYTIQVRDYQKATDNDPASAKFTVISPDGLQKGGSESFPVGEGADGIEVGPFTIDVSKVDDSGNVRVRMETQARFAVYQGDGRDEENFRAIDFNKQITTENGKIRHGGIEFDFRSDIEDSLPPLSPDARATLEEMNIAIQEAQNTLFSEESAGTSAELVDGVVAIDGNAELADELISRIAENLNIVDDTDNPEAATDVGEFNSYASEDQKQAFVAKYNAIISATAEFRIAEGEDGENQIPADDQVNAVEAAVNANVNISSEFAIINNALAFQIGPNTNQNVMIDVPELNTVELGIDTIDVRSQSSANDAIFSFDRAINEVSSIRAKLGAVQNRMEHTINNLQVTHENLTSAESRIRDADMAEEMTEFTKNNILNQSATAMLAQANQLPQGVLQLLQ